MASILGELRDALMRSHVPYMLTGSFASAVHGTPRATQDIDIVIAPTRDQLSALLHQLPESSFYVSTEAAFQAFGQSGQFNVIDMAHGGRSISSCGNGVS